MSMTIESVGNEGNCVNDAIYFVVSSTNSSQSNYKYIADVYVGGSLVARLKAFPDAEAAEVPANRGIFEVSDIIRNYVKTYFDPQDGYYLMCFSSSSVNPHISVDYEIKFGESYGGTDYYNQVSGAYVGYNYYKPLFRGIKDNENIIDYSNKFLTDRDLTALETEFDSPLFVSYFDSYENTVTEIKVTRYSEGWVSIDSDELSVSDAAPFQMYNICPYAINQDITDFIESTDYGYGVQLKYSISGSDYYTDEIRVKIKCTNPKGLTIPLTFLNRMGGYDTLNFSLVNRQRLQIEDKTYKKTQWRYGSGYMLNTTQAGYIPSSVKYSAKHTNTILLRSDYLNETDYNWLRDLVATTEAHICLKEDNSYEWRFYPVIVKTLNWEEKKRAADKMFNLEIEVEVATEIYSQFK